VAKINFSVYCVIHLGIIFRVIVTLRLAVYCQSVHLGWDSRPVIFFPTGHCGHSSYVTSTLTRGCVCRFQLLLVLASAVILSSGSRGTHAHILLSQIWDSPNLEGQVPLFISPRTGWYSYTPRHWVSFSSSPTTRWVTVEVFAPASTRDPFRNEGPSRVIFGRCSVWISTRTLAVSSETKIVVLFSPSRQIPR
jgi:hypothetical protein